MPTKLNTPAGSIWSVGNLCRPNRILVSRRRIIELRKLAKGGVEVWFSQFSFYVTTRPTPDQWKRYNRFWRGVTASTYYGQYLIRATRLAQFHHMLNCDDSARESFLRVLDTFRPDIV